MINVNTIKVNRYVLSVGTLADKFKVEDFTNQKAAIKAFNDEKRRWIKAKKPDENIYLMLEDIIARDILRHYLKEGRFKKVY